MPNIPTQCDLILKGGITSGVIYPRLVSTLAGKFKFKNIGGASAGAIAAAGAAAAEYRRRHDPVSFAGFSELARLPDTLKEPPQGSVRKESMLFLLFQPSKELARHFAVAVGALNAKGPGDRVTKMLGNFVREFIPVHWFAALLGALPGLLLFALTTLSWFPGNFTRGLERTGIVFSIWIAVVTLGIIFRGRFATPRILQITVIASGVALSCLALINEFSLKALGAVFVALGSGLAFAIVILGAMILMLKAAAITLAEQIPKNNFGFCSGKPTETTGYGPESLTQWLSHYFNDLAGKKIQEGPLTFGDLWDVKADDVAARDACRDDANHRALNLEMMTTAISQGLPYRLPFSNELFCFDPDEWADLFPETIVNWIRQHSRGPAFARSASNKPLYRLPHPADFPVAVAVRMSLSFPILLSAIPLYSVDRTLRLNIDIAKKHDAFRKEIDTARERLFAAPVGSVPWITAASELQAIDATKDFAAWKATRVWFSDGGISSNLPLHFFDSKLPAHPTFAVNLTSFHPDDSEFEKRVELPTNNLGGLLTYWPERPKTPSFGSILSFLLDIFDTMHNWRDTVQLPVPGYRDRIVRIAQKPDEGGLNLNMPSEHVEALAEAGKQAADEFIKRFVNDNGWDNHRAVRLRSLLGLTADFVMELQSHYPGTETPNYDSLLKNMPSYRFQTKPDEHIKMAETMMADIEAVAATLNQAAGGISLKDDSFPHPIPDLRIVPRV